MEDVNAENPFLNEEPVPVVEAPPLQEAAIEEPGLNILNDVQGPLIFSDLNIRSDKGRGEGLSHYSDGLGKYTEPAVNKALESSHKLSEEKMAPFTNMLSGFGMGR